MVLGRCYMEKEMIRYFGKVKYGYSSCHMVRRVLACSKKVSDGLRKVSEDLIFSLEVVYCVLSTFYFLLSTALCLICSVYSLMSHNNRTVYYKLPINLGTLDVKEVSLDPVNFLGGLRNLLLIS